MEGPPEPPADGTALGAADGGGRSFEAGTAVALVEDPENVETAGEVVAAEAEAGEACAEEADTSVVVAERPDVAAETGAADEANATAAVETAAEAAGLRHWRRVFEELTGPLGAVWNSCDEDLHQLQEGSIRSVACSLASSAEDDCPLVYVSPGFAALTGYSIAAAKGKNCRFLQPSNQQLHKAFNFAELSRMREFCQTKTSGPILSILMNETRTGERFFNVLYMRHVFLQRRSASEAGGQYIVGLQQQLLIDHEVADRLIPPDGSPQAVESLRRLRGILQSRELDLRQQSFASFVDDVAASFVMEAAKDIASCWIGGKFVPRVSPAAALEFRSRWPLVCSGPLKQLLELHRKKEDALVELPDLGPCLRSEDGKDTPVSATVADPCRQDCPLVYVSKGFEEMTGYDSDFALGRNCRFLQPAPETNIAANGDELSKIKKFSASLNCRPGESFMTVLINEKRTGERFWHVLHIVHIDVCGRRYLLGVQTQLNVPLPLMMQSRSKHDHLEISAMEIFLSKLGSFLKLLRQHVQQMNALHFREQRRFIEDRILTFLKLTCDDFDGDHYVPRLGMSCVAHFQTDVAWKKTPASIGSKLSSMWEASVSKGEELAFSIADPSGEDCPLVYISHEFELLTGYSNAWTLGRSCRFLQPKDSRVNELYNKEEVARMKAFCRAPQPPGTFSLQLLVNEARDGYPFLNLLILEHVAIGGKPFILGVQTTVIDSPELLGELLAMDSTAVHGLQRLRSVLEEDLDVLGSNTLHSSLRVSLEKWAAYCPKVMMPPSLSCTGLSLPLPLVGLELTHKTMLSGIVPQALENGVRHFHFALPRSVLDPKLADLEERLLCLKLAQFAEWLHQQFFHYLQRCLILSMRAPPQMASVFASAQKALRSTGYRISTWMLDISGNPPQASVKEAWRQMQQAKRAGEVSAIGLFGGSSQALAECEGPMDVYAVESYPGKKADHVHQREIAAFQQLGVIMLASNPFGPQNALLQAPTVLEAAGAAKASPAAVLLKAASLQGYAALISTWGEEQQGRPGMEDAVNKTGVEVSSEEQFLSCISTVVERDLPKIHRALIRDIWKVDAVVVEQMEADLPVAEAVAPRNMRRQSTGTADVDFERGSVRLPLPGPLRRQSTGTIRSAAPRISISDQEPSSPSLGSPARRSVKNTAAAAFVAAAAVAASSSAAGPPSECATPTPTAMPSAAALAARGKMIRSELTEKASLATQASVAGPTSPAGPVPPSTARRASASGRPPLAGVASTSPASARSRQRRATTGAVPALGGDGEVRPLVPLRQPGRCKTEGPSPRQSIKDPDDAGLPGQVPGEAGGSASSRDSFGKDPEDADGKLTCHPFLQVPGRRQSRTGSRPGTSEPLGQLRERSTSKPGNMPVRISVVQNRDGSEKEPIDRTSDSKMSRSPSPGVFGAIAGNATSVATVSVVQTLRQENVALRVRLQELEARRGSADGSGGGGGSFTDRLPPVRAGRRRTTGSVTPSDVAPAVRRERTPC